MRRHASLLLALVVLTSACGGGGDPPVTQAPGGQPAPDMEMICKPVQEETVGD